MRRIINVWFCISLLSVTVLSCSKDDDGSNKEEEVIVIEPAIEELLVEHGIWSFTNYNVLEIISSTNDNITNDAINTNVSEIFTGFTMHFFEDGNVIINHPLSGEIIRTWTLFEGDIIFDIDANTPQIWKNIQVDEDILSIETQLFSIFEDTFDMVEHYGRLNFE